MLRDAMRHSKATKAMESRHSTEHTPRRFALRYKPPTVVLETECGGKRNLLRFKLRQLDRRKMSHAVDKLHKRIGKYVDPSLITREQLASLVRRLLDHQEDEAAAPASHTPPQEQQCMHTQSRRVARAA